MGLNEFAGYGAVALSALATGYVASAYGLRPQPFYLGIAFAVIGLKNASARPESAWVGTALAEMLTTEMGAGGQLRIVPAEQVARAVRALRVPEADALALDTLTRVRASLGADTVLVGSYLVLGPEPGATVRLDLRLQETGSGDTLAVAAEEGPVAALTDLAARAGARLRAALGLPARTPAPEAAAASSVWSRPEAAQHYAQGIGLLRSGNALLARDHLLQAVALEPRSPLVHSALAAAWTELGYDLRATEQARLAFDAAPGLDREERLVIEARYREELRDWDRVLEIDRTLFVFFPDDVEHGLRLVRALISAGKGGDALATLEAVRRLPLQPGAALRVDLAEADAAEATTDLAREKAAAGRARQAARALGLGFSLVRALLAEGWALQNTEDLPGALADYAEAERVAAAEGDVAGRANAMDRRASVLWQRHDPDAALRLLQESAALMHGIGHEKGEARAVSNSCNLLGDLRRLAEAARACEAALTTMRAIGDRGGLSNTLNNLGALRLAQWDVRGAARAFEEAARTHRETGDETGVAASTGNLGNMLLYAGEPVRARALIEEALAANRRLGDRNSVAYRLEALAELLLATADLRGARRALEESASIRTALGDDVMATKARLGLARIALEEGRLPEAQALARRCADESRTAAESEAEAQALALLAETLHRLDRGNDARQAVQKARALLKADADAETSARVTMAEARVAAAPGPTPEVRQRLQAALDDAKRGGYASMAFELRLALAEMGMAQGEAGAQGDLEALARDATAKGFTLLARQAGAIRLARRTERP